jgi:hypothetical protein
MEIRLYKVGVTWPWTRHEQPCHSMLIKPVSYHESIHLSWSGGIRYFAPLYLVERGWGGSYQEYHHLIIEMAPQCAKFYCWLRGFCYGDYV